MSYYYKSLKFVTRETKKSDLDELQKMFGQLEFVNSKYDIEVMMEFDHVRIFVAEDLKTGINFVTLY